MIQQNKPKNKRKTVAERFKEFREKHPHPYDRKEKGIFCTSGEQLIRLEKEILDYYTAKSPIKISRSQLEGRAGDFNYPCIVRFTTYWAIIPPAIVTVDAIIYQPADVLEKLNCIEDYLWAISKSDEYLFSDTPSIRTLAARPIVQALKDKK